MDNGLGLTYQNEVICDVMKNRAKKAIHSDWVDESKRVVKGSKKFLLYPKKTLERPRGNEHDGCSKKMAKKHWLRLLA